MFFIPGLEFLVEKARQGFRTYLPGSDAWIWPNNIYPAAKVAGGQASEVMGFAEYISRMPFASTAPDIETLRRHGDDYGLPQLPAAPAGGSVNFVSTGPLTVDTGAELRRADGVAYLVTAGGLLLSAGTLSVPVTTSTPGARGNAEEGTALTIISGVTGTATVEVATGGVILGADVEDIESYRQRILFRKRYPPHGGSASDYVMWARQMPGVTRVFVERLWAGSGTVRVFFFMDGAYPSGIPAPASVLALSDFLATVQPASAIVTVAAPVAHPINVTIDNLVPFTVPVQNAIVAELGAAFLRHSRVAGQDTTHGGMPFLATPATFGMEWIYQAISNADGVESFDLIAPVADTVLQVGETATLGAIAFQ